MRTLLKTRPRAEWLARLEAAKITSGPINTAQDFEADPHVAARGTIIEVPHHAGRTVRVVASPLHLSATPATVRHGIPAPGGDTDAVLADFAGMDAAEIAAARAAGIV
jgi:crotonobetainyl-CoA:carnitine CoA-transferase CaiB-like acyl-CoA transferase